MVAWLVLACSWTTKSSAATRSWTGAVNGYWSEPGNWSPTGAPVNGDSLQFVPGVYGGATMTNDLNGLWLTSVATTSNSGLRKSFRFRGSAFGLSGKFLVSDGSDVTVECAITLMGNAQIENDDSYAPTASNGVFVNGGVSLGGFNLDMSVADHGRLEFDTITGPGSISKSGLGTVRLVHGLGPQLTQVSQVILQAGTLDIDGSSNPSTLITVMNSGATISFLGPASFAGAIDLNSHNLTLDSRTNQFGGGVIDLSGPISGSGMLSLTGYQFAFSGNQGNPLTGLTQVQCDRLALNKTGGARAFSGPVYVGKNFGPGLSEVRWLLPYQAVGLDVSIGSYGLLNLNNHNEDFGPVSFFGGEVDTGTGQIAIYAPVTVHPSATTAVINGYLGLPPGDNRIFIVEDASPDVELQINAVIFGAPGTYFVKQGPGTMKLTGVNTFDTVTLLEEGILDINNDSGLGTWPGLIIFDGATLRISDSVNTGGGIELLGSGVGGAHGAIEVLPNAGANIGGNLLLDATTTLNIGGAIGLGGPVTGNGPLIKTGNGVMSLSGSAANSYSGDTMVDAGQLYLSKSGNVAAVPGNLVIGPGPAGSTTLVRLTQSGEVGGGTVTVNANSLFDLFNNNQTLGVINLNDGGNVATGAGTLTLANGGTVNVGSLNPLGTHASSTMTGFISLGSSILSSGSATVNVAPHAQPVKFPSAPELTISASISGGFSRRGGSFSKNGLGALELSGNNSFIHYLQVNEGMVIAGSVGALGSTSAGTGVSSGAALAIDGGVTISGEGLTLNGSPYPAFYSWSGNNTWDGTIYLATDAAISVDASLQVTGEIGGPGALTKTGAGSLVFTGSAANSYSGNTFVNAGSLVLQRPAGITQIPQHVVIGVGAGGPPATLLQQSSFSIIGQVTVNGGGLWDLSGQAEGFSLISPPPLTLNDGGSVQTGSGILYLPVGGDVVVNPGAGSSTISGNIGLDGGTHHFTIAGGTAGSGLVVPANIGQTGAAAGIQKEGSGKMILQGANSFTGTTTIGGGVFEVDGTQAPSPVVVTGGTLTGTGSVGTIDLSGGGALLAPGGKPGVMTCGSVNAGGAGAGTLVFKLAGIPPQGAYDQLLVSGTVNLAGTKLTGSLSAPSAVNDQFVIISNDGSDAVTGTFFGQPEGSKLYFGGELFSITYKGGDGNDVVLKRLLTPPPPALSIERVLPSSIRLLWATNDPPFRLQTDLDLTTPGWGDVMPLPVVVGANNIVTNPVSPGHQFYRLVSP